MPPEDHKAVFTHEEEKTLDTLALTASRLSEGKGLPGDLQAIRNFLGKELRNKSLDADGANLDDPQKIANIAIEHLKTIRTRQRNGNNMHAPALKVAENVEEKTSNGKTQDNAQEKSPEQQTTPPEIIPGVAGKAVEVIGTSLSLTTFGLIDMKKVGEVAKTMPQLAENATPVHPEIAQNQLQSNAPFVAKGKEVDHSPTPV